jgi:hypothetical protein
MVPRPIGPCEAAPRAVEVMKRANLVEAQKAQGDVVRAAQTIIRNSLPLDSAGASKCVGLLREFGEGNTPLWDAESYLQATVHLAQEIIREVREASKPKRYAPNGMVLAPEVGPHSYEKLISEGWSDALLIERGYLVRL